MSCIDTHACISKYIYILLVLTNILRFMTHGIQTAAEAVDAGDISPRGHVRSREDST